MRLIDGEALLKELKEYMVNPDNAISEHPDDVRNYNSGLLTAIQVVADAPLEQKKGKWIKNEDGTWSCSLCHSWIPDEQHYYAKYCLHCGAELITPLCPWRGADMMGEE